MARRATHTLQYIFLLWAIFKFVSRTMWVGTAYRYYELSVILLCCFSLAIFSNCLIHNVTTVCGIYWCTLFLCMSHCGEIRELLFTLWITRGTNNMNFKNYRFWIVIQNFRSTNGQKLKYHVLNMYLSTFKWNSTKAR